MNLFGKKSYVGIDIGHYGIKVAQVDRVPTGWRIAKLGLIRTPADAVKESVVIDPQAVGVAIKQVLREAGISANMAHIAVSGGSVVVRPVRIPKMTEATLRKSIRFEAGRYVPSSVEDSYIEFEIIGEADETQMDVMIVAAPKDVVESRVKACEFAGLEVDSVDVEPFSVYRSLMESDLNGNWADKTVALVDIGGSSTSVSVVSQGVFAMARTLTQGGHTLTEAIKGYFKLADEDAEAGKAQLDLAELIQEQPRENPPLRVVQPHVDDLIREVRRSLNYYQAQGAEGGQAARTVDAVILSGGGSKMPGMADYFSHKLGMPCISLGVYENNRIIGPVAIEGDPGLELAVVSGLAMRGTKAA